VAKQSGRDLPLLIFAFFKSGITTSRGSPLSDHSLILVIGYFPSFSSANTDFK